MVHEKVIVVLDQANPYPHDLVEIPNDFKANPLAVLEEDLADQNLRYKLSSGLSSD